jgi:hypothetical protein
MTGGGLSRFANRNKPASGSTNLACVAAAVPPGNGAAAADAAARRASEGPDTTSMSYEARVAPFESYVGFENINYDFGGGMVDYGSPILQMNHGVRDLPSKCCVIAAARRFLHHSHLFDSPCT